MSVDTLNKFLGQYWNRTQQALATAVQEAVLSWRLKAGDDTSVRLAGADVFPSFNLAPGLATGSVSTDFTVRLPVQGVWSLKIAGVLNGKTGLPKVDSVDFSVIDNVPLQLQVNNLAITVQVMMDHSKPDRPRLTSIHLRPSLSVASDLVNISVADWSEIEISGRPEDRTAVQASFSANLGKLFPDLGSSGIRGRVTLDLYAKPWSILELDLPIIGTKSFVLAHDLPPDLQDLLLRIGAGDVPVTWGEAPPTPEPAVPAVPVPLDLDTWEAEATALEDAVKTHLIGPQAEPPGVILNKRYADGNWISCDEGRDAAIWTGHLLMSEAFRYANAAQEDREKVLVDIDTVLSGLELLFRVPQEAIQETVGLCANLGPLHLPPRSGLLCRAVYPAGLAVTPDPPFNNPPAEKRANYYTDPVRLSEDPLAGTVWFGFGRDKDAPSRDQIIGVTVGLGWAGLFLDEGPVRERVKAKLGALLDYIIANDWGYPTPSGFFGTGLNVSCRYVTAFFTEFHQQLALLKAGAMLLGEPYVTLYATAWDALSEWTWLPIWADAAEPISKYYKFNLDWNCLSLLLYLETDEDKRKPLLAAAALLRRTTRHHRNAYFNLLWTLAQGRKESDWDKVSTAPDGYDRTLSVAGETKILLAQWLIRRNNTRIPGGANALSGQRTPYKEWLTGILGNPAANGLLSTYQTLGSAADTRLAATYALPAHVRPGQDMDFIWQRDPFTSKLCDQGGKRILVPCSAHPDEQNEDPALECPGIDFLLPYRIARFVNVITARAPHAEFIAAGPRNRTAAQGDITRFLELLDGLRLTVNKLGFGNAFHDLDAFARQSLTFLKLNMDLARKDITEYFREHDCSTDAGLFANLNWTFLDLLDDAAFASSRDLARGLMRTIAVEQAKAQGNESGAQAIQLLTPSELEALRLGDLLTDPAAVQTSLNAQSVAAQVSPPLPWVQNALQGTTKTVREVLSLIWNRP